MKKTSNKQTNTAKNKTNGQNVKNKTSHDCGNNKDCR